ncbi:MAG: hypothetical protein KDA77_18735, partial [Planctomycetaceae bacterium]|nr:hypothetical protein [Planctomycetaceae bacterium]
MTSRRFIGRNEAEVREIINLIEYYRRRSEGGVCIREYEELLPDTEERYFVYRGRAWSRDSAIPTIVEEVADRMDSPFYSVDIVLTGLSGCSAVDPFYQLPGSGFRGYLSTGCYSAGPRRRRINSTIPQRIQPMKKVAIIQESPCILDKKGTLEKAVDLINNASANGAELIVFPEAFVPGYPAWIWRLRPGSDWSVCEELHARLLNNSIDLSSDDLDQLLDAAGRNGVTVVCGVNERDSANSQSTLFNSVVTIDHHGKIVNHHRKLMPTNPERMVWGLGDGHGLNVVDTPVGRTGSLICWENYMPLARYALYSQGVQVYIAPTYDSGEGWKGTMQHIAREGKCWVLS